MSSPTALPLGVRPYPGESAALSCMAAHIPGPTYGSALILPMPCSTQR